MTAKYDYVALKNDLDGYGSSAEPAEVYGFILGFICGGGNLKNTTKTGNFKKILEQFVFCDTSINDELFKRLNILSDEILNELLAGEGITIVMPDDDEKIENRMAYIRELACSFMPGVSVTQKQFNHLSRDLNEFIHDLVDISRMDVAAPVAGESDDAVEEDLLVLSDHLGVGAQICFEECAAKLYPKAGGDFIIEDEGSPVKLSAEREEAHAREENYWASRSKGED